MTQPHPASPLQASEAGSPGEDVKTPLPEALICPAGDILDRAELESRISALLDAAEDVRAARPEIVAALNAARTHGMEVIAAAFTEKPFESRKAKHSYTWLVDQLVTIIFDIASRRMHPLANPTGAERLSLIAVGGYGRGEMAAFSDVDLLFLTPWKITPWAESVIESMLYMMWDLKLKVGHSSRTVKDCIRLSKQDFTIRTSLVEFRHLDGDRKLAEELGTRLWKELFQNSASEFIEAKLNERADRHQKQGGQRYVVEPNVKEGKGGLRDLQSLFWIGKYIYGVRDAAELVDLGLFTAEEYATFLKAEDFLWAVRIHLHLIANRAADLLTFDVQIEVAERMGYKDRAGRRGVEWFMQRYFREATRVGELTRIFLTALEASHTKAEPMLTRILSRRRTARPPYAIKQNRLTVADEAAFLSDKLNMLRIFEESIRTGNLLHPDAMRLLSSNLKLIDDEVRKSPVAAKVFFDTLLKHANPERALRRMNELGVLAAYIPEFEPIVAMMQFNMYHSYTVDEHTIQCISALAQIERGELQEELPVASSILKDGVNRKVLYTAMLLHDIGKGREEDHAVLGARMARTICPRLGLKKKETETVEWLIRYHLLMSDMAQKRDIADPQTVNDFAKAVKTRERLDLLCVLTVCDIRGVGPNVWNNWKAALLRALYRQTRRGLEDGLEALNREEREVQARKNLREALSDWDERALRAETGRHYAPYWQGLHVTAHVDFANLLKGGIEADEVRFEITPDRERDATRICLVMQDHPGAFSRMCGALSLAQANVKDGRTFITKDGYATAAFWIQDNEGHPYDTDRLPKLRAMIGKTLRGEVVARDAFKDRDRLKKREAAFRVPTSITFDNDGSEIYTIIEVDTRDRPGLLYDLTRTLAGLNVYIASAVIATYGEQVVDAFYVKDMFGLKFYSESKRKSLEAKLREAIDRGAERARQ
ncbi:[protein-PII] uridylyltransferase [Pelagovum pacificum]|uniref:Bifunctional uridylyltransferase/uridylyl-removing enzyme n=1 Tax=Pelagovum pacificum TaxID=2588711 RepID=A0A5C5GBS7_9RHOB|nr:[protein-PII] uridylyltransferase [Pelagovum pacificum]QQA42336.1 [protein-PII] uridylyltransferase [Pelagovum pacificum]TNY31420.1 [protein-PII] uridylyltransferase [Pelagovum pacificum]